MKDKGMDENRCEGSEHREPTAPSVARKDEFYWLHDSTGWTVGQKNGAEWLYRGIWCPDDDNLALWRVQIGPRIEEPAHPPTGRVELDERSNTDPQPETTSAAPPSPPAVVDYTERADAVANELVKAGLIPDQGGLFIPIRAKIAAGIAALATEHQAEIAEIKLEVRENMIASKRVNDGYIAGLEARHRAALRKARQALELIVSISWLVLKHR